MESDKKRTKYLKELGWNGFRIRWSDYKKMTYDEKHKVIEDLKIILSEMLTGVPKGRAVEVIEHLAEAIRAAVLGAKAGDVDLVAGKGHEEFQEIRGEKMPFSDRREIERSLTERSRG